jgi:hypothetical protein
MTILHFLNKTKTMHDIHTKHLTTIKIATDRYTHVKMPYLDCFFIYFNI